jgi:hypothetical protein
MSCFTSQFNKYVKYTPTFRYVKKYLFNNRVKIDHVAYRSFDYQPLKTYFCQNNFVVQKERYVFENIKTSAIWLKSLNPDCFRIFLSQYDGDEQCKNIKIDSFQDYKTIQKGNDYVAWTLLHKNDINHIAIEVDDIEEIIEKVKIDGTIKLNNEHNPIVKSDDGKLLQASTISDKILYKFPNGDIKIVPYSFVEFIQRKDGREGFETKNATQIFKSTHL